MVPTTTQRDQRNDDGCSFLLELLRPGFCACTPYQQWLKIFMVEIVIVFGACIYFVRDPEGYIANSWSLINSTTTTTTNSRDMIENMLYTQNQLLYMATGMMFAQTGIFYFLMVWSGARNVTIFRMWQFALLVGDIFLVAQAGSHLKSTATTTSDGGNQKNNKRDGAIALTVFAVFWGVLRAVFLVTNPPGSQRVSPWCCCCPGQCPPDAAVLIGEKNDSNVGGGDDDDDEGRGEGGSGATTQVMVAGPAEQLGGFKKQT